MFTRRAISPKAPRPQTWTAAETDRSEIGPYLGASSGHSSEIGPYLGAWSAQADRSEIGPYLGAWSAHADRSEIGPYLGSRQDTFGGLTAALVGTIQWGGK